MNKGLRIERDAARWLMRRETGEWSPADQAQFDAWVNAAVAHRVTYLHLRSVWQQADRLKAFGAGLPPGEVPPKGKWLPPLLGRHSGRTERRATPVILASNWKRERTTLRKHRPYRTKVLGVAACLALTIALGVSWLRYSAVQGVDYATAVGSTEVITLSDGSHATLSSESRLETRISREERHIDLQQGEGYFEVAKDATRPFVVAAGDRRVIAVGTRFSVRREADGIRVVVTDGVVRLVSGAGAPSRSDLRLVAGSIATATANGVAVQSLAIDKADEYLSWRNGFLQFRDTPLRDAVAEFNRYTSRKLVVGDDRTGAIRVGGNFRWSDTDSFLRLLKDVFAVRAEPDGDKIVLRKK